MRKLRDYLADSGHWAGYTADPAEVDEPSAWLNLGRLSLYAHGHHVDTFWKQDKVQVPGVRQARQALRDWASRYSGYDEHLAEVHPPIGTIQIGELAFTIQTVVFRQGVLHFTAVAGPDQNGRMEGTVYIFGTDGAPIVRGDRDHGYQGVKTPFSTWTFAYDLDIRNLPVTDEAVAVTAKYPPPDAP